MNIAIWIAQGLLAFAFLAAGGMKLASPKEKLLASGKPMAWVEDFSAPSVKLIGTAELLGAIGVVLPAALRIAPILSPIAAVGLVVVTVGAVVVHLKRRESAAVGGPLALCLIAIFVIVTRLGAYAL
jgi:uncharacterized membrane protein YphA (DoxX/SURF4 family)